MTVCHQPVLLKEVLDLLQPEKKNSLLIDATMGEGGHSLAFLEKYPDLRICGVDRDAAIQQKAIKRLSAFKEQLFFYNLWFDDFFASYPDQLERPDLVLLDLGISIYHYQESGRGFSFSVDESLDMRLDISQGQSAADLVNTLEEKELADLIFQLGEERYSRRIAAAIVKRRKQAVFRHSADLANCIFQSVPVKYRHGRIHPATRTFQALRMAVNQELGRLQRVLEAAFDQLVPGGKMGVISFHSLEDRPLKRFFKRLAQNCICGPEVPICKCGGKADALLLNKKPLTASQEEVKRNPASRSAKLRVIRKLKEKRDYGT